MGQEIDLKEARTFYQKAAEDGDGYAQWRLSEAYKYGELGLAIDLQVADMWFKKSDASAQLRLAEAYEEGELGLLTDMKKALQWRRTLANKGWRRPAVDKGAEAAAEGAEAATEAAQA